MNYSISKHAEYGEYVTGPRIVTRRRRPRGKRVLNDIQSGISPQLDAREPASPDLVKANPRQARRYPIEEVGTKLRGMMPWISEKALVDKSKN